MITELMRAMARYKEQTGEDMDTIVLSREHYEMLRNEMIARGLVQKVIVENGMKFNGAFVEVV